MKTHSLRRTERAMKRGIALGFTLVEVMAVVAILAILVTIVVVSYRGLSTRAVESSMQSDLDSASGIIERDRQRNAGQYPDEAGDLNAGAGIEMSGDNELTYVTNGDAYCITATSIHTEKIYSYSSLTHKVEETACGALDDDVAGAVTTLAQSLNYPTGIATNSTEFVYVAESNSHRILKISASGVVSVFAGSTTGASGFTNGNGTAARFYQPFGLGIDSSGNLYVADEGNEAIRKITPAGQVTTLAGGSRGANDGTGAGAQFADPYAVSVDPATDEIYATQTADHKVRKITQTGVVTTLAGSSVGFVNGTGSSARFDDPLGIAFQGDVLYVADWSNHAIRRVTKAGAVTTPFGTNSPGYIDASGNSARFNAPIGLTVRGDTLYVADSGNHRVRKINLTTGDVSTYA